MLGHLLVQSWPWAPNSPDCAKEDAREQLQLSGDRVGVPLWAR